LAGLAYKRTRADPALFDVTRSHKLNASHERQHVPIVKAASVDGEHYRVAINNRTQCRPPQFMLAERAASRDSFKQRAHRAL